MKIRGPEQDNKTSRDKKLKTRKMWDHCPYIAGPW